MTFIAEKDPLTANAIIQVLYVLNDELRLKRRQIELRLFSRGVPIFRTRKAMRVAREEGWIVKSPLDRKYTVSHEGRKVLRMSMLGLVAVNGVGE